MEREGATSMGSLDLHVQETGRTVSKSRSEHIQQSMRARSVNVEGSNPNESGCCRSCCLCLQRWFGCECCCCYGATAEIKLDIQKDRFCTDVPCLLFFIGCIVAQVALFFYAMTTGSANPEFLIYYTDWHGELCTPQTGLAAWPDIRIYDIRLCLPSCNDTMTDHRIITPDLKFDWRDLRPFNDSSGNYVFQWGGYPTKEFFKAYCIPDTSALVDVANQGSVTGFLSRFDAVGDAWTRGTSDVITAYYVFIICVFTGIAIAFLYGWFLRKFGWLVIYVSIFVTIIVLFVAGFFLIKASETVRLFGYNTTADAMYYSGVAITVIGCGAVVAVCFLWKRIRLAITLSEETSFAFTAMPMLLLWPLIPFAANVVYMVWWCVAVVFMTSVTEKTTKDFPAGANVSYYSPGLVAVATGNLPTPGFQEQTLLGELNPVNNTYTDQQVAGNWKYAVGFHWFMLLWVTTFIGYHSYMTICGAYAEWYFAAWEDEENHEKVIGEEGGQLGRCPVCRSCWRATRYHMGTIAIGAGVIAVIKFAEHVLTYIERQTGGEAPNTFQIIALHCARCCLRCLQCIFDRINKNGFVVTAVHGSPFCSASFQAIALIFRNMLRAAALSAISGYLELVGKIAIICANLATILIIMRVTVWNDLTSPMVPFLICAVISYFVAVQYMHIYEVGINTVFICFLIDEEANKSDGVMRAHKNLLKIIGANKKFSKEIAMMNAQSSRRNLMSPNDLDQLSASIDDVALAGETEMQPGAN